MKRLVKVFKLALVLKNTILHQKERLSNNK